MLAKAGIPSDGCVEKRELQERLVMAVRRGQGSSAGGSTGAHHTHTSSGGAESVSGSAANNCAPQSPPADPASGARPDPEHDVAASVPLASSDGASTDAHTTTPTSPQELKNWIPAQAPDGSTYYWHRVTRAVRWDKPDSETAKKMEARISGVRAPPIPR